MKKFLAVFLSVMTVLCVFAGCSSDDSGSAGSGSDSNGTAAVNSGSSLDYFVINDGVEILELTEKGAKQKELIIPASITSVSSRAFAPEYFEKGIANDTLEKITFLNPDCQLSTRTFADCTALKEVELPGNLKEIPKSCFEHCTNLKNISILDSVTSIGEAAFNECLSLESVTFGNSVVSIGEEAFRECTSLTSLEFNNGLETIGDYAFADCKSITNITIPESVAAIGAGTFSNAYDTSGEYKITVTRGSWADTNFDSYKSADENVQKVYA